MKVKFVCYDDKSGNTAAVEVDADTLDACEQKALKTTGMRQISRARIIEGDLDDVLASPKVRITNLN